MKQPNITHAALRPVQDEIILVQDGVAEKSDFYHDAARGIAWAVRWSSLLDVPEGGWGGIQAFRTSSRMLFGEAAALPNPEAAKREQRRREAEIELLKAQRALAQAQEKLARLA